VTEATLDHQDLFLALGHKDHQGSLEPPVCKANLAAKEALAQEETQDHGEILEYRGDQEVQVVLDLQAPLVIRDRLDHGDLLDQVVYQGILEDQAPLEQPGLLDRLVLLEVLDLLDHQDLRVNEDHLDCLAQVDHLEAPAP